MKLKFSSILLIVLIAVISCSRDEYYTLSNTDAKSIFEIMADAPECAEFVAAAKASGYDKVLQGNEIYTVLIPPSGTFDKVDGHELKVLVANHIVFGRYFDENWNESSHIRSVSGKFYRIIRNNEGVLQLTNNQTNVNFDGKLVNLEARNGVAQSIDKGLFTVPNLQNLIQNLDPVKYSIFLQNYNVFDSIIAEQYDLKFGFNDLGEVILMADPAKKYEAFNPGIEDSTFTLLVPSDNAINAQKNELIKKNGGFASRISKYYYTRLFKNQLLLGNYNSAGLLSADTIYAKGGQWVVGRKLTKDNIGPEQVASNGYLYATDKIVYKPIAADFIDSLVFEAEWATGFDGHEKTLVSNLENEPTVAGDGQTVNYYLYVNSLNAGNKFNIFIPNVFKGKYALKFVYKPSGIVLGLYKEGKLIRKGLNMSKLVLEDPNNTDPNFFANARVGYLELQEDGYLDLEIRVEAGTYSILQIDKIVLVPLEF